MPEAVAPNAAKIMEWAARVGLAFREVTPTTQVAWGVEFPGIPFAAMGLSSDPATVVIQLTVALNGPQIAELNTQGSARERFTRALTAILAGHHVDFDLRTSGFIRIERRIYSDGFGEDRFWRDVRAVRCAATEITAYLQEALGGAGVPQNFVKPN